jgi:hypothetical protein
MTATATTVATGHLRRTTRGAAARTPNPATASGEAAVPAGDRVSCGDLLELLTSVSDGRQGQGRDHPVPAVLALAAGAVVAGMRSFTAIAGCAGRRGGGAVPAVRRRAAGGRAAVEKHDLARGHRG